MKLHSWALMHTDTWPDQAEQDAYARTGLTEAVQRIDFIASDAPPSNSDIHNALFSIPTLSHTQTAHGTSSLVRMDNTPLYGKVRDCQSRERWKTLFRRPRSQRQIFNFSKQSVLTGNRPLCPEPSKNRNLHSLARSLSFLHSLTHSSCAPTHGDSIFCRRAMPAAAGRGAGRPG